MRSRKVKPVLKRDSRGRFASKQVDVAWRILMYYLAFVIICALSIYLLN